MRLTKRDFYPKTSLCWWDPFAENGGVVKICVKKNIRTETLEGLNHECVGHGEQWILGVKFLGANWER